MTSQLLYFQFVFKQNEIWRKSILEITDWANERLEKDLVKAKDDYEGQQKKEKHKKLLYK